ncbi:MAG: nuclear transport factor 2 family protein [Candidatus Aminicenantes bacterium]|nr:nuclear transport factor 2 family protein [Candidatus Aminicenantes bacterium]
MQNKIIVGTFLTFFVLSSLMMASDWTKEQKEVWQTVETYAKLANEGNFEGFTSYYHDDFLGWVLGSELPDSKQARMKANEFFLKNLKNLYYEIRPVGIKVHGNFAIVHYYQYSVDQDISGKQITQKYRWTDILMKQGDKWMMVADSGGVIE